MINNKNSIQISKEFEEKLDLTDGGKISTRRRTKGSKRRSSGAFFTPPGLISFSVKTVIDFWINDLKNKKQFHEIVPQLLNLKIIDPSVGSGLFLLGCRQYLREELIEQIPISKLTIEGTQIEQCGILLPDAANVGSKWDRWIVENILWGVDNNPEALRICKEILQDGFTNKLPDINLQEVNTLTESTKSLMNWLRKKSASSKWNIVIGNPPWGIELPTGKYLDCKGESALAFCNQAYDLIDGNGIISFVLPGSWLQAGTWTTWRKNNLQKMKINQIYLLDPSVFPSAVYTAPPILAIFGLDRSIIECKKLVFDDGYSTSEINGKLFPSINKYIAKIKIEDIIKFNLNDISSYPKYRIPLASKWWVDNFFETNGDNDSFKDFIQIMVRGVKTNDNSQFVKKYKNEEVLKYTKANLDGFQGKPHQWSFLAKGGSAIFNGKPTYFLQNNTHIIRWDKEAVHEYKKSNGLRNLNYYGTSGVGFPSSGRYSPVFRYVNGMIFDADYILIIPKREEDQFLLLSLCNSPVFLYAAKNLFNHSSHFKASDLLDMHFPHISDDFKSDLIELSKQILISIRKKDEKSEFSLFNNLHRRIVEEWNIPISEERKCLSWYIKRFPGMAEAFN